MEVTIEQAGELRCCRSLGDKCMADNCMAWRWVDDEHVNFRGPDGQYRFRKDAARPPIPEDYQEIEDWLQKDFVRFVKPNPNRRGTCGLAGYDIYVDNS